MIDAIWMDHPVPDGRGSCRDVDLIRNDPRRHARHPWFMYWSASQSIGASPRDNPRASLATVRGPPATITAKRRDREDPPPVGTYLYCLIHRVKWRFLTR